MEDSIRRNLALSPLGKKVELMIGDAKESLRLLGDEAMRREARDTVNDRGDAFDLVFIDADKKEYCDYLDLVLPLTREGGWILADNTLWDGHIIDPAYDKDKQTVALRAFNDKVAQDERLEKVILPLRDGLTIIRKVR
jgi:predicted O-methyltransferase YrrM